MSQKIYDDEREYTEAELQKDATWAEASRKAYKAINGSDFNGTDEEAASEGLSMMGEFNYNLALGTIPMASKMGEVDDESKLAFYYMMDTYDKKDISWNGVGRFLKGIGTDPTTYVGISTLGIGLGAKEAAKFTARQGLKEMLKTGAKKFIQSTTAVAATEGALYVGAEDVARQEVGIQAGVQEEYDPTQTAVAAGMGAAGGAGLVQATKAVGKGIGKAMKSGEEAMAQAAGGGTPPSAQVPFTDKMKSRTIQKPFTVSEKTKIYRGESEGSGEGFAMYGQGLYSTTSKKEAAKYGDIREVGKYELPENPLQFKTKNDFSEFEYDIARELGIRKNEISQHVGEINEYVSELGYDGIAIGTGKDKMFVTFPIKDN